MHCEGLTRGAMGRILGWCGCPYVKLIFFTKYLQFTLVKVNWLQAALMVRHQATLCHLTFGGSSVSGQSALEGTALP